MTTLTANNQKLIIVEVPEKSYSFHLDSHAMAKDSKPPCFIQYRYQDVNDEWFDIELPICGVSLLGTITNGDIDFDVSELVDKQYFGSCKFYKNYMKGIGAFEFMEIHDSFLSLLSSNNIEYKGKKLVALKIK